MGKAVVCPVCGGTGKVVERKFTDVREKTCHGCGGLGWVEVSER